MITVFEASNSLEGHMVANLLEQANIYARVDGDFLQGGVGELQPFGIIKVVVNNEDFERAKLLVVEWEAAQPKTVQDNKTSGLTWLHLLGAFLAGVIFGVILV